MPLPMVLQPHSDPCHVARAWKMSVILASKLIMGSDELEFAVAIISGSRTPREQDALRKSGRPAASNDKSTHLACPATGADLRPQIAVTNVVKARLGAVMTFQGLRWGGGGPVDGETGIPEDWNHFDLGPR